MSPDNIAIWFNISDGVIIERGKGKSSLNSWFQLGLAKRCSEGDSRLLDFFCMYVEGYIYRLLEAGILCGFEVNRWEENLQDWLHDIWCHSHSHCLLDVLWCSR